MRPGSNSASPALPFSQAADANRSHTVKTTSTENMKFKMKGRSKSSKRYMKKQKNVVDAAREERRMAIERAEEERVSSGRGYSERALRNDTLLLLLLVNFNACFFFSSPAPPLVLSCFMTTKLQQKSAHSKRSGATNDADSVSPALAMFVKNK